MLRLSRRPGERVLIGDDIVVSVESVRGDQVGLGFDAPDGVRIARPETVERMRARGEQPRNRHWK